MTNSVNILESLLVKKQEKVLTKTVLDLDLCDVPVDIVCNLRYDDRCRNGHNTFSISFDVYYANKKHTNNNCIRCGQVAGVLDKHFPELAYLDKWHLVSSEGPLHYIANTSYWADEYIKTNDKGALNAARSIARWPEATAEQLQCKDTLNTRLPRLMLNFKKDIESIGFNF